MYHGSGGGRGGGGGGGCWGGGGGGGGGGGVGGDERPWFGLIVQIPTIFCMNCDLPKHVPAL